MALELDEGAACEIIAIAASIWWITHCQSRFLELHFAAFIWNKLQMCALLRCVTEILYRKRMVEFSAVEDDEGAKSEACFFSLGEQFMVQCLDSSDINEIDFSVKWFFVLRILHEVQMMTRRLLMTFLELVFFFIRNSRFLQIALAGFSWSFEIIGLFNNR